MSRAKDITFIEQQIRDFQAQQREIQEKYRTYHDEVTDTIRKTMEDAGVFEKVHALETDRVNVRRDAEGKANQIQVQLNALATTRNFLMGRDAQEAKAEDAAELKVEGAPDAPEDDAKLRIVEEGAEAAAEDAAEGDNGAAEPVEEKVEAKDTDKASEAPAEKDAEEVPTKPNF